MRCQLTASCDTEKLRSSEGELKGHVSASPSVVRKLILGVDVEIDQFLLDSYFEQPVVGSVDPLLAKVEGLGFRV